MVDKSSREYVYNNKKKREKNKKKLWSLARIARKKTVKYKTACPTTLYNILYIRKKKIHDMSVIVCASSISYVGMCTPFFVFLSRQCPVPCPTWRIQNVTKIRIFFAFFFCILYLPTPLPTQKVPTKSHKQTKCTGAQC